ncbi:cytidine deaminase [Gordonia sp. HY285]|uniref:cytidine deaminase n=1 Tax=Gordonia liuliyuniae TaxID=2911517 RepID=UPI001F022980|nr:cytidine deaminase [Gordonia liuliyuniae]MCF8611747.1 cytidine deaminase [Gordonia liuliyuniae]
MVTPIDFEVLRKAAATAMTRAYAPYSRFPVGAAALTGSGELITAANVENVSYGLGLCAEVALVSVGVSRGALEGSPGSGNKSLVAVAVCDGDGRALTPCGRCRQVLLEFGGPDLLVDGARGPRPLGDLLPDAFGPGDLDRVRRP